MSVVTSARQPVTPAPRRPRLRVSEQKSRAALRRKNVQTVPTKEESAVWNRVAAVEPTTTAPEGVSTVPLNEEAFRGLSHTRSLFLCCRNLVSLSHVRHLEHMTGLISLNAHMNAITRIEGLSHLQHLTELDVSANELCSVDENAFIGLVSLRRLNLSSNFLSSVSGLEHLPALEWLSLSFNHLTDVNALRQLTAPERLTHFDVCGNRIAACGPLEDALARCTGLLELRVETPQTSLVVPSAPPHLRLRENPFCARDPHYSERLLRLLPRLARLNGVACGVDPAPQNALAPESALAAPAALPAALPAAPPADLPPLLCDESASSDAGGRWRAKRVSRGVGTDPRASPDSLGASPGSLGASPDALGAALLRAREQLALRGAHEADLRRHVADARRAAAAAAGEGRRLARQVAALKAELSRRAEEAAGVALRHRADAAALAEQLRARQREAHDLRMRALVREEQCARRKVEGAAMEAAADVARCAAREARAGMRAQSTARRQEWRQWDAVANALRQKLNDAAQRQRTPPRTAVDRGCEPHCDLCDAEEVRRIAEALDEARAAADALRGALTAAVEKTKDAVNVAAASNEKALVAEKRMADSTAAADTAIRDAKIMTEARDAAISEAKAMAEARDAAIREAKAMADARDAAISEAKITAEARDAAIREAKAMAEARDAAISEAKTMAEAAVQEKAAAVTNAVAETQIERDNLIRTVRNLRDSLASKDAALDDLEEEAKAKIDEKRAVIARLESQLRDGGQTAVDQRRVAELEQTVSRQMTMLQSAAEALARVRAQLTRVDAVNEQLDREAKDAVKARDAKDAELREMQAQWRNSQDSARARQRATLQALAQMMADGSDATT